jgi:2-polyprenyl-3-methyl-5-hydroxy-6-metoxy-1,4-benzoquinol methylase
VGARNFWCQEVKAERVQHRMRLFNELLNGKRSLHVGCADWPLYDPATNLHCALLREGHAVDGYDQRSEALVEMNKECSRWLSGRLYDDLAQVGTYQCVLVPETIEHTENAGMFLQSMDDVLEPGGMLVLTAPNALSSRIVNYFNWAGDDYTEIVHPDHNCWYSVYTLTNLVRKVLGYTIERAGVVEPEETSCFVVSRKGGKA